MLPCVCGCVTPVSSILFMLFVMIVLKSVNVFTSSTDAVGAGDALSISMVGVVKLPSFENESVGIFMLLSPRALSAGVIFVVEYGVGVGVAEFLSAVVLLVFEHPVRRSIVAKPTAGKSFFMITIISDNFVLDSF